MACFVLVSILVLVAIENKFITGGEKVITKN